MILDDKYPEIKDNRGMSGRKYGKSSLLSLIEFGISCGRTTATGIVRYANQALSAEKCEAMGFPNGVLPHGKTIGGFMRSSSLDFSKKFAAGDAEGGAEGKVFHMDGKTSRGAKKEGKATPHHVNLYDGDAEETVAQASCENGAGTEREAAKRLLQEAEIKGATITADAGFTPGDLPAIIAEQGAFYLLRAKKNVGGLFETMVMRINQCAKQKAQKASGDTLTGGTIDERVIALLPASLVQKMLPQGLRHATFFGMIRKKSTHKKSGKTIETSHLFITNLPEGRATPDAVLKMHREHWRVENDLHRSKDLYLHEDKCKAAEDNAPAMWAWMRSKALARLKKICKNIPEAIDTITANKELFFQNAI